MFVILEIKQKKHSLSPVKPKETRVTVAALVSCELRPNVISPKPPVDSTDVGTTSHYIVIHPIKQQV